MTPAERQQAALFADYQEALARDPAAVPPPGLDSDFAAVARDLAGALSAPAPSAAFLDRLGQQLGLESPGTRIQVNGRAPLAALPPANRWPGRAFEGETWPPVGSAPPGNTPGQSTGRAGEPGRGPVRPGLPGAPAFRRLTGAFRAVGYLALLLTLGGGMMLLLRGVPAAPPPATVGVPVGVASPGATTTATPTPEARPSPTAAATPATPPARTTSWEVAGEQAIDPAYGFARIGNYVDRWPQFSPDGRQVAYLPHADGTQLTRLLIYDVASGEATDITPDENYRYTNVRWSPDGARLLVVRDQPAQNQTGPAPSEIVIMDADGRNQRILYRADFLLGGSWSPDGQYLNVGGTVFGGLGTNLRVRVADGVVEPIANPSEAAIKEECGIAPEANLADAFGGGHEPENKSYRVCVVKYTALASNLTIPGATAPEVRERMNALVRYDPVSRQRRVFIAGVGLQVFDISPTGRWVLYTSTSQEGVTRFLSWDMFTNSATEIGGDPFNIVQNNRLRWTADGRVYFVALPTTAVNHPTGYLYELNAVTGQVRLVTRDWQLADVFGVSPDGRSLIVNQRVDAPQGGYALHLVRLAPVSVPRPAGTPTPTLSPAQSAVPPEAVAAAQGFLEARRRGDRAEALTFLAPELRGQPPASIADDLQDWGGTYYVVDQYRDATGRATITVQRPGPDGQYEQSIDLEQRDGRWVIVGIGPSEKLF